jgi:RimJ/RimL family protein N-acetyltransferase
MHSYTDQDPGPAEDVELVDARELASFRSMVDDQDWEEGGFAGDVIEVFVLRETSGQIVAAAGLTEFLGGPADVGVVVHPARRGHGFGSVVGRAATSYAVQHGGIARWRALKGNVPSRKAAAALGFEDYCRQLAIRG